MSSIDLVILGIVLEKPQSAYDIQKDIEYHNFSRWTKISIPSIYKKVLQLKEKGYQTYGITPKYDTVDGDTMYKCLKDVHQPIDVVVFVVNPKFATPYLDEMKDLGIQYAWMQPGTYNDETIKAIQERELEMIQACVLVLS